MEPHPVILFAVQVVVTILVVGFTSQDSPIRLASLLPVVTCVWLALPRCMEYMTRSPWAALLGGYLVTYLYQYLDIALLSRWTFESGSPSTEAVRSVYSSQAPKKRKNGGGKVDSSKNRVSTPRDWWARLAFGASVTSSFRFVGTPYQVRNVPRFSTRNPTYIPSRSAFLHQTATRMIISYLLLDILSSTADPKVAAKFFSLHQVPLFMRHSEVSAEELTMRFFATLGLGISMACVQGGVYSIVALLSVALNLSEPKSWPPLYGPVSEAYSLRCLWSAFWHQTNARKFASISNFIVFDILRISPGGWTTRYLRLLTTFLVSGVMHLLIDVAAGLSIQQSGAMRFFSTQALGIVWEDCVVQLYRSLFVTTPRAASMKERLAGYIWVAVFLTWSTPVYMYPMLQRTIIGNDSIIPFSVVGKLRNNKW